MNVNKTFLAIVMTLVFTGTCIANDYLVSNWTYLPVGENAGLGEMEVIEQPEQFPEILMTRSGSALTKAQNMFGPNGYAVSWNCGRIENEFQGHSSFFRAMFHEELLALGRNEVILVFEDGFLMVDLNLCQIKLEYDFPDDVDTVCFTDINGDGDPELILSEDSSNSGRIYILETESQTELEEYPYRARKMVVGQVDTDPGLELVFTSFSSDSVGYVLDLETAEIEWVRYPAFGDKLQLSDIDNDGMEELIALELGEEQMRVFDLDQKTVKWEIESVERNNDFLVTDIDDDGHFELLTTTYYNGPLHCYKAIDGTLLWQTPDDYYEGVSPVCADLDLDGVKEILFTNDQTGDKPSFFIVDSSTRQLEWSDKTAESPLDKFFVADIDGSGNKELGIGRYYERYGYDESFEILIFDTLTHKLVRSTQVPLANSDLVSLFSVEACPDIPGEEIGIITNKLTIYNSQSIEKIWESELFIQAAEPVDLDMDGNTEIVAFGSYSYYEPHMVVFDAKTGAIEFESVPLNDGIDWMEIADIDNDGIFEIGVITNNDLSILNGASYTFDWLHPGCYPKCFDFGDIDPDTPGIEIIYSKYNGEVYIYSGITHTEITRFTLADVESIYGIEVADVDADGVHELVLKADTKLLATDMNGTILWSESVIGYSESYNQKLLCQDINHDGVMEVLFGNYGVFHEYRHGEAVPNPGPTCDTTGVTLEISQNQFQVNDPFYLNATVCNTGAEALVNHHVVVLLDVFGQYFSLPSWIDINAGLDTYHYTIPSGGWEFNAVPYFLWPEVQGTVNGVKFYGAILEPSMTNLVGNISMIDFGWM